MTLGTQAAASIELSRAVLIASLESREVGGACDAVFGRLFLRMTEDAREGIESGAISGPDAETVVSLLMASYLGAALHCTSSPHAKPLAEVLRPLVDATLAALAPRNAPRTKARPKAVARTKDTKTAPKKQRGTK
jgi:hypothetical protein